MKYRRIPGTDLDMSALCLGAADFGSRTDEAQAFALLDRFVEAGGNFVDTATFYGRWLPEGDNASERIIGRWLRRRGHADDLVIATKGGHPEFSPGFETRPLVRRLDATALARDLDDSLHGLGVDAIDLYWLHYDDPSRPVAELIDTLERERIAGRIRHYGCCNWSAERLAEAQAHCAAQGLPGFVANQPMWSLATPNPAAFWVDGMRGMDDAMRRVHVEGGLACVPYSAQAEGFFDKAQAPDFADDPRHAVLRAKYLNPETSRRASRAARLAGETGHTPTQLALACLMAQPFVTVPIIGARTPAQLASSLDAIGIVLDDWDLAFLAGR